SAATPSRRRRQDALYSGDDSTRWAARKSARAAEPIDAVALACQSEAGQMPEFAFELEFSDDWVEAFDAGLEQVLIDIEKAQLPQEMVAACSFSICDATGVKLVEISASQLECSGLPRCDLFAGTSHGVPADFPLKVCFGVPKARSSAWLKASSPGGD
ncbi:unnamed protein product, partial [Polarella glacialis]